MSSGDYPLWVVILVAVVGGGGTTAISQFVLGAWKDRREAALAEQAGGREERSIALTEIDRAIPGLGEIIAQQRQQLRDQEGRIVRLEAEKERLIEQHVEQARVQDERIAELQDRVGELEHELAQAQGAHE